MRNTYHTYIVCRGSRLIVGFVYSTCTRGSAENEASNRSGNKNEIETIAHVYMHIAYSTSYF